MVYAAISLASGVPSTGVKSTLLYIYLMSLGLGEGLGGISDMHLQVKEGGKPLA